MSLPRFIIHIRTTDRCFPGEALEDPEEPCSRCGRSLVDTDEVPLLLWRAKGDLWRFGWACSTADEDPR